MEMQATPISTKKKRTEKDYRLGFKLNVVKQVEQGDMTYKQAQLSYGIQGKSTVLVWLRKYGKMDWKNPRITIMSTSQIKESPSQQIKRLEKELEEEKIKNLVLNEMINISDKQYGTSIRKKYSDQLLEGSKKKKE